MLRGDDAALYESHVSHFIKHCEPAGDEECNLVQSLADTEWRLLRIPSLEIGIYALGRLEFAELFPKEDEAVRQFIEAVNDDRQDEFDNLAKLGFEFSLGQIEVRAMQLDPTLFADWDPNAEDEVA